MKLKMLSEEDLLLLKIRRKQFHTKKMSNTKLWRLSSIKSYLRKKETKTYVIALWKMKTCQKDMSIKQIKISIYYFKTTKGH